MVEAQGKNGQREVDFSQDLTQILYCYKALFTKDHFLHFIAVKKTKSKTCQISCVFYILDFIHAPCRVTNLMRHNLHVKFCFFKNVFI